MSRTIPDDDLTRPANRSRGWLIAHLVSLAVVAGILVVAARGQYFYYDEWDFLAARAEWNLLAPHVGHLSFFPQLLTTVIKGVFGLHSYWPFLIPTIAVHVLLVHLLWRVMVRAGAQPLLAILGSMLFGVLAPGADNTLWAFQIGFITPFVLGLAALLIVWRPAVRSRDLAWATMILVLAAGFSGTALPMVVAVVAFLLVRQGWRAAFVPALGFGVVYGAWYLAFNRGPAPWDYMRADSPWEFIIGVPQFVAHGFVDSVAGFLPLAALAPVVLVLLAGWIVIDLRRTGLRHAGVVHYLVLALIAFAVLTALSRVGLGNAAASAGRYAYVYGLLLVPATVVALTRLAGSTRTSIVAVSAVLALLAGYNAGGLMVAADAQRIQEQTVPRAMSAALDLVDCGDAAGDRRTPAALVAPTLTIEDICSFVSRGQFSPVEFGGADMLDVRINLLLEAEPVDAQVPTADQCEAIDAAGTVGFDIERQVVYVPAATSLRVQGIEGDAVTEYARVILQPGTSRLHGPGFANVEFRLGPVESSGVCVFDLGDGR